MRKPANDSSGGLSYQEWHVVDCVFFFFNTQATPLLAGLAVAATAIAGRYGIQAWQAFKARPVAPRMRRFYDGGFQPTMTRREAALILGIRLVQLRLDS